MLFTKRTTKLEATVFQNVCCKQCGKYYKEAFQIPVKIPLMPILVSKSKQQINFRNTLFSYFIYLREQFQQQTNYTTDFEAILASFWAFW